MWIDFVTSSIFDVHLCSQSQTCNTSVRHIINTVQHNYSEDNGNVMRLLEWINTDTKSYISIDYTLQRVKEQRVRTAETKAE